MRQTTFVRLFRFTTRLVASSASFLVWLALAAPCLRAQALPPPPPALWPLTIVLPPKLVAGEPATLAVLSSDGRLAPAVEVEIGHLQGAATNSTGRASFRVPEAGGALVVHGAGVSASALLVSLSAAAPASALAGASASHLSVAPIVSLHDRFAICGGHFSGEADANQVTIDNQRALVLAASPECLVVLAAPQTQPGPATISVDSGGTHRTAPAVLVSLTFQKPALSPARKAWLVVHVRGFAKPLALQVENGSPDVLQFLRGDSQRLRTSGGAENSARIQVQAIRSGDFSFRAALLAPSNPEISREYLEAAEPLAQGDMRGEIRNTAEQIERHPRDVKKADRELQKISGSLAEGDLRTLIDAARAAISW